MTIYLYVLVLKLKKKRAFKSIDLIFLCLIILLFFCKSRYSWYSTFFLSLGFLFPLSICKVSVVSYLEYLSISSSNTVVSDYIIFYSLSLSDCNNDQNALSGLHFLSEDTKQNTFGTGFGTRFKLLKSLTEIFQCLNKHKTSFFSSLILLSGR